MTSEMMERSMQLRNDKKVHYNCAHGVFIPFAERKGIPFEQAKGIAADFGAGMRTGSVCGAITGGLMVMGLCGLDKPKDTAEFFSRMKELHEGRTLCRDLLSAEVKSKEEKKPHCDRMVYEAVEIIEDMLKERGIEY